MLINMGCSEISVFQCIRYKIVTINICVFSVCSRSSPQL
uniref:Uncharacterized protein n=1 Tax=Anguilla anguilla TaxID=7936 RepID=A0A0E9R4Q6_ANGAN